MDDVRFVLVLFVGVALVFGTALFATAGEWPGFLGLCLLPFYAWWFHHEVRR